MHNTLIQFNCCISDINGMRSYYTYLNGHYKISEDKLADLLRSELVNIVSALDRFIHEIVRIGIVKSFNNTATQTAKCQKLVFRLSTINKIIDCSKRTSTPTCQEDLPEYWVNYEVVEVLKSLSFQKIDKIKDALSYIWNDQHKIQSIVNKMKYSFPNASVNDNQKFLEQQIDLIATRRNQIVHEADFDMSINMKQTIDVIWLDHSINFIKDFVYSVYENITNDISYQRL